MKTLIIALAAVAMTGLTTATVYAEPALPTAKVFYGDLDLHSAAGIRKLTSRVRTAASHVCGNVDSRDLGGIAHNQHCRRVAFADAMKQLPDGTAQELASR